MSERERERVRLLTNPRVDRRTCIGMHSTLVVMSSFYTEFESLLFFLSTAKTRILCNRQACFSVALKQDSCLVTHFPCYSDQTPNPEQNMRIGMNSTLVVGALACAAEVHHRSYPHHKSYRGTSLIRNRPPPEPYTKTMSRALWWRCGVGHCLMREVPL